MKRFFANVLASILGGLILIFLLFFLLIGLAASLGSSSNEVVEVKNGSFLHLNITGVQIVDRNVSDPMAGFGLLFGGNSMAGVNEIIEAIERAETDDRIEGITLDLGFFAGGSASAKEIRDALLRFKKNSHKPIYSYGTFANSKSYYIASVSDSIGLNPSGLIDWTGMNLSVSYYKDLLQNIGVEVEVIRGSNNQFKSAVEPFLQNYMSDANRTQLSTLAGDLWGIMLEEVAEARSMDVSGLQTIADSLSLDEAKKALSLHFVDVLMHEDEWTDFLRVKTNVLEGRKPLSIHFSKYIKSSSGSNASYKNDRIAVLYAQGEFTPANDNYTVSEENMIEALEAILKDDKVKALILRVNSPGGQAYIADKMVRMLEKVKEKMPVVVSMGDVAASAGYMISAIGDTVLAHPNTVTGSIGVFGMLLNYQDLMENKIGIHTEHVQTAAHSSIGSPDKPLDAFEKKWLQTSIDRYYGQFLNHVAQNRNLDSLYVDSIGQGRVWSGKRAVELGLVDGLGTFYDAQMAAKNLIGEDESTLYNYVAYPEPKDPFEEILTNLEQYSKSLVKPIWLEGSEILKAQEYITKWQSLSGKPMMRIEEELSIP
jgi:protease IV